MWIFQFINFVLLAPCFLSSIHKSVSYPRINFFLFFKFCRSQFKIISPCYVTYQAFCTLGTSSGAFSLIFGHLLPFVFWHLVIRNIILQYWCIRVTFYLSWFLTWKNIFHATWIRHVQRVSGFSYRLSWVRSKLFPVYGKLVSVSLFSPFFCTKHQFYISVSVKYPCCHIVPQIHSYFHPQQ